MPEGNNNIDPKALDFLNQTKGKPKEEYVQDIEKEGENEVPLKKMKKQPEKEHKRVTFIISKESDLKLKLLGFNLCKLVPKLLDEYLLREDVQKLIKENIKVVKG